MYFCHIGGIFTHFIWHCARLSLSLQPNCCPDGGIGRHEGLKIPWPNSRTGSSPVPGTMKEASLLSATGLSFYSSLYNPQSPSPLEGEMQGEVPYKKD